MDNTARRGARSRPIAQHGSSQIGWFWVGLASLTTLAFAGLTSGLWAPAVMMFDAPGVADLPQVWFFAIYSACGPLAAIAGLVAGWWRILRGERSRGVKWMILLPLIWLIGLLGLIGALSTFCADDWSCGI